MKKPLIVGNWKMNKTIPEALDFIDRLKPMLSDAKGRDVVIAPPFTALRPVVERARDSIVRVSAQNIHWEESGAFTGEVSARMVSDCGCEFVIVGHSERRNLFGERDRDINRKIGAALSSELHPIFCIGETLDERESGDTLRVIGRQIKEGLMNLPFDGIKRLVLAYEPVWAIGTGKTASPGQAQEVHVFIRKTVESLFGKDICLGLRILYGGSVQAGNIDRLMAEPDIDGVLVGGASLDVESFARIIQFQKVRSY